MRTLAKIILGMAAAHNCIGLITVVRKKYELNLLRHPRFVVFVYTTELVAEAYAAIFL